MAQFTFLKREYALRCYFPRWIGFHYRRWKRETLDVTNLFVWLLCLGFWELHEENPIGCSY